MTDTASPQTSRATTLVSRDEVAAAQHRLRTQIRRTPVMRVEADQLGAAHRVCNMAGTAT